MMICREVENEETPMKVLNNRFLLTKDFKYLAVTLVSGNREETQNRLKAADTCYWSI